MQIPVPICVIFLSLNVHKTFKLNKITLSFTTTKGTIPYSSIAPIIGFASTAIALEITKDVKAASNILSMRTNNRAALINQL